MICKTVGRMVASYWPSYRSLCYHPTDRPTDHYAIILLMIMLPSYWPSCMCPYWPSCMCPYWPSYWPSFWSLCYHPTDHYILLIIMLPSNWPSYWSLCFHPTDHHADHYATILLTVLQIIMLPSYWPSYRSLCYHPADHPTDDYATILLHVFEPQLDWGNLACRVGFQEFGVVQSFWTCSNHSLTEETLPVG